MIGVGSEIHRPVGQAAGDLGQQPSGDQDLAFVDDLTLHRNLSAGFVIEAAHRDTLGVCLDEQSSQDRDGRSVR